MELTIEQKLLAINAMTNIVETNSFGELKSQAEDKLIKLIKSLEVPNIIATIEVDIKPTPPKEESDIYKKVKAEAKAHLDIIYHNYCNNSLTFKSTITQYLKENL
jgi:hypothetical protein